MSARDFASILLASAGIKINGTRSWDMKVHNERVFQMVLAQGTLGLGEAYQLGYWDCDDLKGFFTRLMCSGAGKGLPRSLNVAWMALKAKLQNRQDMRRATDTVKVHYDLPPSFFQMMYADSRITGSCAYWKHAYDLNQAQEDKHDLVCRKLGLVPNSEQSSDSAPLIGDIGCGWSAWMSYAATHYEARCVGVSISKEQIEYGQKRYADLPIKPMLLDYRKFDTKVDHLVSMGMFEHVGHKNYREYFEIANRVLNPNGLFVLHTIWADKPEPHIDPWLDKYIFPNGVIPTIGQITTATHGLFTVLDVHNFGPYYTKTLEAWSEALWSNKDAVVSEFGMHLYRTQQYYLLQCAAGFDTGLLSVGQLVLAPVNTRAKRSVYEAVR